MSSIVIIQQSDAVYFITDGAQYDPNGTVTQIRSKVVELPRSGCAFALRGANWPAAPLQLALNFAPSFDAIVDMLPALLRELRGYHDDLRAEASSQLPHPSLAHFEISVGGWSERMQRMVAVAASTWDVNDPADETGISAMDGYQPCAPWIPGQGFTAPAVDIQSVLGRTLAVQADIDALDVEADGFALHVAQRTEGGVYCGAAAYLVGGFAELTAIKRDGIERRVIHTWPDTMGSKITPQGAAPLEFLQAVVEADQARTAAIRDYQRAKVAAQEEAGQSQRLGLAEAA